jgi:hypothetical protein
MTRVMPSNGMSTDIVNVERLVTILTFAAWTALILGAAMSLFNVSEFNDRNVPLMVGIGFMVGSVHIYVIRTAIHLVHTRALHQDQNER